MIPFSYEDDKNQLSSEIIFQELLLKFILFVCFNYRRFIIKRVLGFAKSTEFLN